MQPCVLFTGFQSQLYRLRQRSEMESYVEAADPETSKGFLMDTEQSSEAANTGEKLCACTVCGAEFSSGEDLNHHMRSHTGENPFACTRCDAKFSQGGGLEQHMRTHTREKPL